MELLYQCLQSAHPLTWSDRCQTLECGPYQYYSHAPTRSTVPAQSHTNGHRTSGVRTTASAGMARSRGPLAPGLAHAKAKADVQNERRECCALAPRCDCKELATLLNADLCSVCVHSGSTRRRPQPQLRMMVAGFVTQVSLTAVIVRCETGSAPRIKTPLVLKSLTYTWPSTVCALEVWTVLIKEGLHSSNLTFTALVILL